ncbi:MAG: GYD domain-containing protein [Chloroflexi bacterium]|nr:GYD domain-containing protein [Chloroflexota bacterium]MBV9597171.1 GYD domain-containing protein [Chloroflexota bacterium]
MTRFVIFFSLTGQTIGRFIDQPSDRAAAVRTLLEPVGGKLVSYDFMFGEDDGMVIFEVPDSQSAAAISLAVSSTGAFARIRTHELIPAENLTALLDRARSARQGYRPPGA